MGVTAHPDALPLVGREAELDRLASAWEAAGAGKGNFLILSGEAGVGKTALVEEMLMSLDGQVLRGWCMPEVREPLLPIREALRSADLEDEIAGRPPPLLRALIHLDEGGLEVGRVERGEETIPRSELEKVLKTSTTFLKDSLGSDRHGVDTIGFGDHRILVVASPRGSLVAVLQGRETERLRADLDHLARRGDGDYLTSLQEFLDLGRYSGGPRVPDPELRREDLFDNILLGLRRQAVQQPLVLFIDDLQWADPSTLDLLRLLARNIRSHRLLMLATLRPEEVSADAPIEAFLMDIQEEGIGEMLDIGRLDLGAMGKLATNLLAGKIPEGLAGRLHAATAGNALFARELLRSLIEEEVLSEADDGWVLTGDPSRLGLPEQVEQVVLRRLDRLSEDERVLLETVAVFGRDISTGRLACMTGQTDVDIDRGMAAVGRTGLLHPAGDGWGFDHVTVRDALYQRLPGDLRSAYHLAAAECFLAEPDPDEHLFDLSFHLSKADDTRAYTYAWRAGQAARADFANLEASAQFKIALRFAEPVQASQILEASADVAKLTAEYPEAMTLLDDALAAAATPTDRSRLLCKQAAILSAQADLPGALAKVTAAAALVTSDEQAWAEAGIERGEILWKLGEPAEASAALEQALVHTKPEWSLTGRALHVLGNISLNQGDYQEAMVHYESALQARESVGDRWGASGTLSNMGVIQDLLGHHQEALAIYRRAAAMCAECGDRRGTALTTANYGAVYLRLGRLAEAEQAFEDALETLLEVGDRLGASNIEINLGTVAWHQGLPELARRRFREGLDLKRAVGDRSGEASALDSLAGVLRDAGDLDEAESLAREALGIREEIEDPWGLGLSHATLAEIAIARGDLPAGQAANERCLAIAEQIGASEIIGPALARGILIEVRGGAGFDSVRFEEALANVSDRAISQGEARFAMAAALAIGEVDEARIQAAKAQAIFDHLGNQMWLDRCEELLGRLGA